MRGFPQQRQLRAPQAGDEYWTGSTWTVTETFFPASTYDSQSQAWTYTGLVNKWKRGKWYFVRMRATDRAANVSDIVTQYKFLIAAQAVTLMGEDAEGSAP